MTVKPDQRWRLTRDYGNPPLHLREGSIGVVREVVPADVPGAHNAEEDSAVLDFEQHELSYEGGQVAVAASPRAVALALIEFGGPDALLEEAP